MNTPKISHVALALVLALVALSSSRAAAQTPSLQLVEPTPHVRQVHNDQLVGRVFAGLGMGVLAATVGGSIGGFAGAGIGSAVGHEQYFSLSGLAGGLIGHGIAAAALMPLAVAWAGSWLDGRGDIWAAYLGELVGIAGAVGLLAGAFSTQDGTFVAVAWVGAIALPLLGAIVGYEISDGHNRAEGVDDGEPDEESIAWMPTAAPTADGQGLTIGAVGSF